MGLPLCCNCHDDPSHTRLTLVGHHAAIPDPKRWTMRRERLARWVKDKLCPPTINPFAGWPIVVDRRALLSTRAESRMKQAELLFLLRQAQSHEENGRRLAHVDCGCYYCVDAVNPEQAAGMRQEWTQKFFCLLQDPLTRCRVQLALWNIWSMV